MKPIDRILKSCDQSEKEIEKYLVRQVTEMGGLALKYASGIKTGYPDRLIILNGKPSFWVELKSKGEKPRPIQEYRIEELRNLGQNVYVADSKKMIDLIIQNEIYGTPLPD